MTTNKMIENKKAKEQVVSNEIKELIKNISKEKYLYTNSDKVFNNVSNFYFLSKRSQGIISLISSKFLMSSFSLEYLKLLNKLIETKYDIPQLTLTDFENSEKIEDVKIKILNSEKEPFMIWLQEKCLIELNDAIDNLAIEDLQELNKLGHIIKLTSNELLNDEKVQDIELYDTLYRFIDRLEYFEVNQKKKNIHIKYNKIKKSKEGNSTEINFEIKCANENVPAIKKILEDIVE